MGDENKSNYENLPVREYVLLKSEAGLHLVIICTLTVSRNFLDSGNRIFPVKRQIDRQETTAISGRKGKSNFKDFVFSTSMCTFFFFAN